MTKIHPTPGSLESEQHFSPRAGKGYLGTSQVVDDGIVRILGVLFARASASSGSADNEVLLVSVVIEMLLAGHNLPFGWYGPVDLKKSFC